MKRGNIFIILLAGFFFLPVVSAEIYFSDISGLYNKGDIVSTDVILGSTVRVADFLRAYFVCEGDSVEIHKSVQVIEAETQKTVNVAVILDRDIIGDMSGNCYLEAEFRGDSARSGGFVISRGVNINIQIEGVAFAPGEQINVTGTARKHNGENLNGFVEVSFEGTHIAVYEIITENEEALEENANEDFDEIETEEEIEENETQEDSEEVKDTSENDINENETQEDLTESSENDSEAIEETVLEEISVEEAVNLGSISTTAIDGQFSLSFIVPENAYPGKYTLRIRAYDQDRDGNVLNEGELASHSVIIKQIIKEISIEFNENVIIPGNEFKYTVVLYDQAGNKAQGEAEIILYKPDETELENRIVRSKEENVIVIETNFTPGYWSVLARKNNIEASKIFLVEELELLDFELRNDTLHVKNVGNIRYIKEVEISIGGVSEVKLIDLEVGAEKRFRLNAPDGEYVIEINDGNRRELGVSYLTGRAIAVDAIGGLLSENLLFILILLIIVIVLIISFVLFRRITKRRISDKPPRIVNAPRFVRNDEVEGIKADIIDGGLKEDASIITLKIRNLENLKKIDRVHANPLNVIDNTLMNAKQKGAQIYVDGDYRILILSPNITKSIENSLLALNIANKLVRSLNLYNSKTKNKIDFGVGVHFGSIGKEISEGKIKFASLGSTIPIAKRIADASSGEVLFSEEMHKRTLGKVKSLQSVDKKYWILSKMPDKEDYEEFIIRFLNRQKKK